MDKYNRPCPKCTSPAYLLAQNRTRLGTFAFYVCNFCSYEFSTRDGELEAQVSKDEALDEALNG